MCSVSCVPKFSATVRQQSQPLTSPSLRPGYWTPLQQQKRPDFVQPKARARRSRGATASVLKSDSFRTSSFSGSVTPPPPSVQSFDFLVLGSGIAGLTYAIKVAEYGKVAVVTKQNAHDGCTQYAQGGVCAVLDPLDSVEAHIDDTIVAGGFLNDREAVEVVCREGPSRVLELVEMGAEFTRNKDGSLHLTKEGGHSGRRIVHAADVTGREIERALVATARAHPNISFFEHHLGVDLVWDEPSGLRTCLGADVLDQKNNSMTRFVAPVTMLATGGAGQVYPYTTNPSVATGDGMAMAYRARAMIGNMEFVQFHPTGLYSPNRVPGERCFLISEAVRGEGGRLFNQAGERFMERYDSRMELAPRDVVARSIQDQMLQHGQKHMLLDISHKPADEVLSHFPNIAARCLEQGVDITRQPIPVVPTQHYMCGGVQTGLRGETGIAGLFATGEVACTGLHGANRLASNSLLEGLVFAERAVAASVEQAEHLACFAGSSLSYAARDASFSGSTAARRAPAELVQWVAGKRAELGEVMWGSAGIVRCGTEMRAGLDRVSAICREARAVAEAFGVCSELVELRNLATVGELILASALQRKESRGLHYCVDFPTPDEQQRQSTLISRSNRQRSSTSQGSTTLPAQVSHLVPRRRKSIDVKPRARPRDLSPVRSQPEE